MKKWLISLTVLFLISFILLLNPFLITSSLANFISTAGIIKFETNQKVIALTIDDGPHPTITPLLLDLLKENQSRATFFLTGQNIQEYPDIVDRIISEGHEIGNHMQSHNMSILLDPNEFDNQVLFTDDLIKHRQSKAIWLRPGGGVFNRRMSTQADALGYKVVLGSVYPYDATVPEELGGSKFMQRFIKRNIRPGDIIILHDGRIRTVNILEGLLPELSNTGYQFVTLSELSAISNNDY